MMMYSVLDFNWSCLQASLRTHFLPVCFCFRLLSSVFQNFNERGLRLTLATCHTILLSSSLTHFAFFKANINVYTVLNLSLTWLYSKILNCSPLPDSSSMWLPLCSSFCIGTTSAVSFQRPSARTKLQQTVANRIQRNPAHKEATNNAFQSYLNFTRPSDFTRPLPHQELFVLTLTWPDGILTHTVFKTKFLLTLSPPPWNGSARSFAALGSDLLAGASGDNQSGETANHIRSEFSLSCRDKTQFDIIWCAVDRTTTVEWTVYSALMGGSWRCFIQRCPIVVCGHAYEPLLISPHHIVHSWIPYKLEWIKTQETWKNQRNIAQLCG